MTIFNVLVVGRKGIGKSTFIDIHTNDDGRCLEQVDCILHTRANLALLLAYFISFLKISQFDIFDAGEDNNFDDKLPRIVV